MYMRDRNGGLAHNFEVPDQMIEVKSSKDVNSRTTYGNSFYRPGDRASL